MNVKTEGIVLKEVKILNAKRLLTVLTEDEGKIIFDIRYKVSNKNVDPSLPVLTLAKFNLIKNKERYKLESFEILKSAYELVKNYETFNEISKFAIFINKIIPENAKEKKLFEIFKNLLNYTQGKLSLKTLILSAYFKVLFNEGLIPYEKSHIQKIDTDDQKLINFFVNNDFEIIKKYELKDEIIERLKNYIVFILAKP
ncbi:MAG: DNA repair protein RecO [Clostridiales Family XIII bacterium]|jgi:DNA repair protein RecO|nr:DNA repair protein RecO [Clostridiales Family XIII bacterium]